MSSFAHIDNKEKKYITLYTVFSVLFSIFFTINVRIGACFPHYTYTNRIKKIFLKIMIMFVIEKIINITWGKSKK